MAESINVAGQLNYCYIFFLRATDCARREAFMELMCHDQISDYYECRFRIRHVN